MQSSALNSNGYDKLGFFELAILYLCLGVGSLFATPLMQRLGGPRLCMVIGSACDTIWILTSIIPALKEMYENSNENDGYEKKNEPSFLYSDVIIYTTTAVTSVLGGLGEAV